jgi:hypothetical protein
MMDNRFYENRMAIKAVAEERSVDVSVASKMYAVEQGWTNYSKEMDEWNAIQRKYIRAKDKTLADLFK